MTDGHLDATVLAKYDEGLLTPPQANEVEAHLAQCASCTAVLGQLAAVRARLAAAPPNITMPASVAARIDDALAAEREQRDHEIVPARTGTVHPFRRRIPQLLAAAATVAAIGFAGYVISISGDGDETAENATVAEGGAHAGDSDDDGAGRGATDEEAAGGEAAAPDALRPAPDERTALTEQIQAIASSDFAGGGDSTPQRLADDCGRMLARELGWSSSQRIGQEWLRVTSCRRAAQELPKRCVN